MKVSNRFTLARLIFAPVFFLIYSIPVWTKNSTAAFISALIMIPLLAVIQMTDYWDGHYARKNGEVSDFGKLFDPFADVMLNLTAFVCAMNSFDSQMNSYMPALFFILIMYREFSSSADKKFKYLLIIIIISNQCCPVKLPDDYSRNCRFLF